MQLTNEQAVDATRALEILGQDYVGIALAAKISRMQGKLQPIVRALTDARKQSTEAHAEKEEDGSPKVREVPGAAPGTFAYVITPADSFAIQKEYDDELAKSIDLEVEVLTLADFPAKVRSEPFVIRPNVLVGLGPLFSEK